MSKNLTAVQSAKRRKQITFAWVGTLALVIILLVYFQQAALIYLLSTVGVTILLAVVALADITGRQKSETPLGDDSAALASSTGGANAPVRPAKGTRR